MISISDGCWTKDDRVEVLEFIKPVLHRFLFREALPNLEVPLKNLTGLTDEELNHLKSIHFLLSKEVDDLIEELPKLLRNLSHSTHKEIVECRGIIRGRINWNMTFKERFSQGFNDPSLFICQPSTKMYDLPENQLLNFILRKIRILSENIDLEITEELLNAEKWKNWQDKIITRYLNVKKISRNVYFQQISIPRTIKPKMVYKAYKHRNQSYDKVADCYMLYENLFLLNDQDALRGLIEKQTLEPLNNDKLFEIFVLFKVLDKLRQKSGNLSLGLLKPGYNQLPYVAQYNDENETINVYYQKMPGGCWKNSEYKEIFKVYDLNVSSRRPDIILEFEKDNSYCLIEVKRTDKRDYIVDSVYKVIGYLNDFKTCFPYEKALDSALVVWKGIKIKDWPGAVKNPILILNYSDLDKGLCKILSIPDQDNQMNHLISEIFNKHFCHWGITLPEESTKNRESGYIQDAGWLIQYCFGEDENGDYLDYYAAHRMTDDSQVRIYANGKVENLPALEGMFLTSEDPIEAKRLEEEHDERNRKVLEMLVRKGFDKFTINMYLQAGLDKTTE